MKRPPYASNVIATPAPYWLAGTWVVIFAGSAAWQAARVYTEHSPDGAARVRHTLVCPPGDDPHDFRWPVRERRVCVCDTGDAPEQALVTALVKAGASKIGIVEIDLSDSWWAQRLPAQPDPVQFDLALVREEEARDAAEYNRSGKTLMRLCRDFGDEQMWADSQRIAQAPPRKSSARGIYDLARQARKTKGQR